MLTENAELSLVRRPRKTLAANLRALLVASVSVLAFTAIRIALDARLGYLPFILFVPAVLVAALVDGLRGGVWATILSLIVGWIVFTDPRLSLLKGSSGDLFRAATFLVVCAGISISAGAMRRYRAAERQTERRFRGTFENAAVGMAQVSLDGRWLRVNEPICGILKRSERELLSLTWADTVHPEDRAAISAHLHELIAGRTPPRSLRHRHLRPDGAIVWISLTASVQKDDTDSPEHLIFVVDDITEQKRTAEVLAASEERMRLAQEAAHIGSWSLHLRDASQNYWSPEAYRIAGIDPRWRPNYAGWLEHVHPDDRSAVDEEIQQALADVKGFVAVYRFIGDDGAERWHETRATLQLTAEGAPLAAHGITVDITSRRRAELEIRRTQRQVENILHSIQEGFLALDREWRFTYANQRIARALRCSPEDLLGGVLWRLFPALRGTPLWANLRRVMSAGDTVRFIVEFPEPDQWHEVHAFPTEEGLSAFLLDVTAQHRATRALEESEERYRFLAEAIPQFVWTRDQSGRISYMNSYWTEYTGLTTDDVKSGDWLAIVHPEDRPALERARQRASEGRDFELEFRILRASDGRYRWNLARGRSVPDASGVTRWIGLAVDIDDRKRAEEAARSGDERFRSIVEAAAEGIWIIDTEGRTSFVNPRMAELLGYTPQELSGRLCFDFLHPEDLRRAREGFAKRKKGGDHEAREYRYLRSDGKVIWLSFTASPMYDAAGQMREVLAMCTDMTERRIAEQNMREAQKLESIGLLAGGIAHDFNNLLVGILGNASLGQEMVNERSRLAELLRNISAAGERAAHLTRQLLAYAGKGRFLLEDVNLEALTRGMGPLLVVPSNVRLQFDLQADLPPVLADVGQMQQVVMNLILNAAEAIGERQGVVSVRTRHCRLETPTLRERFEAVHLEPGEYALLEVQDDGCGMSQETRARIFDPFFTTKFTGRGLGLAAVAGIIRSHKGAIQVESTLGVGSTFTVLLPLAGHTAALPAAEVRTRPAPARSRSATILVVDDEEIVLNLASRALEIKGHRVLQAPDGHTALSLFRERADEIDAVLLDLSMPGVSGGEVLLRLREIRDGIGVIVSSGYSESEALRIVGGQPVAGFIQKPYRASELSGKVQDVLSSLASAANAPG